MDQEIYTRFAHLEARMGQMEALMQRLLTTLSTSHDHIGQTTQLQQLQQELASALDPYAPGRAGFGPAGAAPGASWQQPQQNPAISNALMAGDKIKAIKLYREQYGVDLQTAKNAIDAMERQQRGY